MRTKYMVSLSESMVAFLEKEGAGDMSIQEIIRKILHDYRQERESQTATPRGLVIRR